MTRAFVFLLIAVALVGANQRMAAQRERPSPPRGRSTRPDPPNLPAPPSAPAPAQSGSSRSRARLFEPQDLGLTEGPDRADWQKPDQIMDALKIADGSVVADIGAAGGW